ncbi:MAG: diguanylate cyclase [Methylococcaceae bacterium]|nr:diguanylate cyclase [Methylococcaceae bacterium]
MDIPLKISEKTYQVTIESMLDEIVVIDRDGKILMVNEAWRQFSKENGPEPGKPPLGTEVGDNYLEVCLPNTGITAGNDSNARDGIQAVLDGRLPVFSMEYPCHTPNRRRWFKMLVLPLSSDQQGVVIAHSNITEFKLTEEALRLSEERWKFALEGSGDGVWDWNFQTGEALYSKRWKEMFGFAESEIGNHSLEWSNRVHPDDIAGVMAAIQAHIDGKTPYVTHEFRMRCKDQNYQWTLGRGMVVSRDDNDQPLRLVGTNTDITVQKRMTAALQESEDRFRGLANAAPTLIWVAGTDKLCNWFNDTWHAYTGRSMEQEFGHGWTEGLHPDDLDRCIEIYVSHFDARQSFQMEYRLRGHDGEYHWFIDVGRPRFDGQGEFVGYIGMLTDISQRKAIEVELIENKQRLTQAQQIAHLGSWDWNVVDDHVTWSDEAAEIYVPDNKSVTPSFEGFKSSLHPDDFDRVMGAIKATFDQDTAYDIQHRVVSKLKGVRYVHAQGKVFRNADGKAIRLVGTAQDITERKLLEDELKRQVSTDFLTGLSSRSHFMEQGELELSRASRYDNSLSIFMMDVDFFKSVNDSYGHKVGDTVLKKLAEVCGSTLRDVDIVGRIGGEEFAILLPETDNNEAAEVAERLRNAIANVTVPLSTGGQSLHFTVSIGVASLASKGDNLEVLLNMADKALYEAKNSGRNRVCVSQ